MTDRAAILARLARLAAANATHKHLAGRLCEASRLIMAADGAWITVQNTNANRTTLCNTDQVAGDLEDLQDVVGEGPCPSAFDEGRAMTASLTGQPDARWPEFSRAAWQKFGALTLHAFPMRPGGSTFGVLNFYSIRSNELTEPADMAQFLADAVGAALLRDPIADGEFGDSEMWAARAQVHQATGMVIAQLHVPAEDALAILRAHAYANDTTLAEIAHQVIERRVDFREES